jgi:hypothetical protein
MSQENKQIKIIREALRGQLDSNTLGEYGKAALQGAGFGAATGGIAGAGVFSAPGAAIGAGVGALGNMGIRGVDDLAYRFFSTNKKIAWQAGDLQENIDKFVVPVLSEINPQIGAELSKYAADYKKYIDYYIRDEGKGALENNSIALGLNQVNQVDQGQADTYSPPPEVLQTFGEMDEISRGSMSHNKFVKISQFTKITDSGLVNGNDAATFAIMPLTNKLQSSLNTKLIPNVGDIVAKEGTEGLAKGALKGAKGLAGMGVGLLADYTLGKGYDFVSNLMSGGKIPAAISSIKGSSDILKEIDKLSMDLPKELQSKIQLTGNMIYGVLMSLNQELQQLQQQPQGQVAQQAPRDQVIQ